MPCGWNKAGRQVGATHDRSALQLFSFTIDARDACGHDRAVGGDAWRLLLLRQGSGTAVCDGVGAGAKFAGTECIALPQRCAQNAPGVCDQPGNGVYTVRFSTSTPGTWRAYGKAPLDSAFVQMGDVVVVE